LGYHVILGGVIVVADIRRPTGSGYVFAEDSLYQDLCIELKGYDPLAEEDSG